MDRLVAALLMVLLALAPSSAFAGGWAVVTLDAPIADVRPDQPFTVGFVVRQHGVTPRDGLSPIITAIDASGKRVSVHAREEGAVGHYVATMTLPAGTWEWQIDAYYPIAYMGQIVVEDAATSASVARQTRTAPVWILWAAGVTLVALGGVTSVQRRRRVFA